MAFETGTATGHKDLLTKLKTFLTTNATLVGASQNWTTLRDDTDGNYELWLEGPGLAGSDAIYVGLRTYEDVDNDYYNLGFVGSIGFDSGLGYGSQPGISAEQHLSLWDSAIDYWFVANGRRFLIAAKVGTVFESAYLGFYLPYNDPGQIPYPHCIGGTSASGLRWSDTSNSHRFFVNSYDNFQSRDSNGVWYSYSNYTNTAGTSTERNITPYSSGWGISAQMQYWRPMPNDDYAILPCVLHRRTPTNEILGELDGVFAVSGFSASSEDIVQIGGTDYVIIQDAFRTGVYNYIALELS